MFSFHRNSTTTNQSIHHTIILYILFPAMFAPGFLTGKLVAKIGAFSVSLIGGIIFAASAVVFLLSSEEWAFIVGMMLLGIGWNFSFSAGTIMLTETYKPHEATQVQAVNDFILFSVAGGGSLLSGVVFSQYGWLTLVLVVAVMMGLNLVLFVFSRGLRVSQGAATPSSSSSPSPSPIPGQGSPYYQPIIQSEVDEDGDNNEDRNGPAMLGRDRLASGGLMLGARGNSFDGFYVATRKMSLLFDHDDSSDSLLGLDDIPQQVRSMSVA